MGGYGEAEHPILVGLVKPLEAGPEDKMIEKLVHSQHTSSAIHQSLHLHQSELIESIGPYIEGMSLLDQYFLKAIVEGSCAFDELGILVALDDVDIGADGLFERKIDYLA